MRRDLALILRILRHVRDAATGDQYAPVPDFEPEHTRVEVRYHVDLCCEAGLLRQAPGTNHVPSALCLTWQGHEWLDQHNDC